MTVLPRSLLIIVLLLTAGVALLPLMPLRVAAAQFGIVARHSQGSILTGALRDASLGRVRIGDVNARLRLLPLLTGKAGFALLRGDVPHAPGVAGTVGWGWNGLFAENLTVTIDAGALLREMDGSEIRLESVSVAFANGKCATASGTARLSLNDSALGSIVKGGLMGNAECRNGELYFSLLSQSTMERAFVRIKGDGSYQVTFIVAEPSPDHVVALGYAGFQPVAGGVRLVRLGKLH